MHHLMRSAHQRTVPTVVPIEVLFPLDPLDGIPCPDAQCLDRGEGVGETLVPPRYRSRRKKMSRHQEMKANPATFQPIDDPNAHAPPGEPLPSFPLEIDMSAAMSGAPRHVSCDLAGHGAGPSFWGIHDGEATSCFNQAVVNATQARGRGLYHHAMINPQHSKRRALHVEEGFAARGLAPILPTLDTRPGLLDTDTIDMPGVCARTIYSFIFPRNEGRYFRNAPKDMDEFECHLTIVSFPVVFLIFLLSLAFSFLFAYLIWNFVFIGCLGRCGSQCYESCVTGTPRGTNS